MWFLNENNLVFLRRYKRKTDREREIPREVARFRETISFTVQIYHVFVRNYDNRK